MTHFVVALSCEARPLLRHYGMEHDLASSGYRLFRSADDDLIVSGVGKTAAAGATAWLAAATANRDAPWINVGIAGHRSLARGEGLVAHRIVDDGTGRSWYPPRLFSGNYASSAVISVDKVEDRFEREAAYEMEAAGFWPTANRFATAELVQCYKVVSDGLQCPARELTAEVIEELVESRVDEIERLATDLRDLHTQLPEISIDLEPFLSRWRLSVSQQRQLASLLRRWSALRPTAVEAGLSDELVECLESEESIHNASQLLSRLRATLDSQPLELGSATSRSRPRGSGPATGS